MKIEWTPERMLPDEDTAAGLEAALVRPSDGANIRGSLMPPGHEFNDGPEWAYSLFWDTGEDPQASVDAHLMAEAPDEGTARRAAEAGMVACLEVGAGPDEVRAAIRATGAQIADEE